MDQSPGCQNDSFRACTDLPFIGRVDYQDMHICIDLSVMYLMPSERKA